MRLSAVINRSLTAPIIRKWRAFVGSQFRAGVLKKCAKTARKSTVKFNRVFGTVVTLCELSSVLMLWGWIIFYYDSGFYGRIMVGCYYINIYCY